jgi:hypothetical protein
MGRMDTRPFLLSAAIAAMAWLAPKAQAQAGPGLDGFYAAVAGGLARVSYDCGYFLDCDQRSPGAVRAALGWRSGRLSLEGWVLRLGDMSVGDAVVARTLRLSGWGGVAAFHFGGSEASDWHWRLGLLNMRHERDDDGTAHTPSPLVGVGWTTSLTPRTRLQLAWDFTRADGHNVSTSLLHLLTAGLLVRF